jgi:hypothetical protein
MKLHALFDKLEAQERSFVQHEVLAPVLSGRAVAVRIAGIVCRLQLDDVRFCGWAVLQPLSMSKARMMRKATRSEVQQYLQLLPIVRLIVVTRHQSTLYALPAQNGDSRFQIRQPVPVLLSEENVQPFDVIVARFDGNQFWFEERDARHSPLIAAYLRRSWHEKLEPEHLQKKGLSVEEKAAYAWAWQTSEEGKKRGEEYRIAKALGHAQAELLSFIERDDVYTVTYRVQQHTHTSTVRKNDLSVLTSGICLSGRDADFDLTSLVGVMSEAQRIGHDMDDYDEYD